MKKLVVASLAVAFVVVLGCVRIPEKFEAHITVDIRQQVQERAADTLDFIEGKTPALPSEEKPDKPKKSSWLQKTRDVLSPMHAAYAAGFGGTSPEKKQIVEQLRNRSGDIQALKNKGIVGENNRGYLEVRDPDKKMTPDERNEAQRLVAAECKDRKALYQEDARIEKEKNVSVSLVERTYAMERLRRAKPGDVFQLPPAGQDFDAFKASEQGRKLGAECVPEAWVTIK